MAPGQTEERTTVAIDLALIAAFITLAYLLSVGLESVLELRQIKRAKFIKAVRNHPSGKAI